MNSPEAENIEKGQEKLREFLFIGKQSPSLSTTSSIKMEPRLDRSFPTMGMPTRKSTCKNLLQRQSQSCLQDPITIPTFCQRQVYLGEAGLGFPPSGVEESNSDWFRPWEGASERQIDAHVGDLAAVFLQTPGFSLLKICLSLFGIQGNSV